MLISNKKSMEAKQAWEGVAGTEQSPAAHFAAAGTKQLRSSPGQGWEEDTGEDAPRGNPADLVIQEAWVGGGWVPS